MNSRQRLVVCLDGTWNRKDSSTNVLHHFNLAFGGMAQDGVVQKKLYHRGVGTGVLDSVSGGAFGFGLEQNVRDGYNWLVQNYCEGDEVYIFGFSRGAYTARSLVGFISQCGLLRRGAPITVQELWENYCLLGRMKEERHSAWDWIFPEPSPRMRSITTLVLDSWAKEPWPLKPPKNESEVLLIHWSRRIPIKYLGIYDTVGAIGWDALAIPGLRSKLALHNNLRPTTIIQHCRHALAIDEHRSSFNHTPFLAYLGHKAQQQELLNTGREDPRRMWADRIEQCWFVGAHSNVGGGYDDDRFAHTPLVWVMEGALRESMKPVLACEDLDAVEAPTRKEELPRDSFAEFLPFQLAPRLLRAKPNFRKICPADEPHASVKPQDPGFTLHAINETLHPSAKQYWENGETPPNLWSALGRWKETITGAVRPRHVWLPGAAADYVAIVVWACLASAGLFAVERLVGAAPSFTQRIAGSPLELPGGVWGIVAVLIAFAMPLVDWAESRLNFECALDGDVAWQRAAVDALYWIRAAGFVLLVFGAVRVCMEILPIGWRYSWDGLVAFWSEYWAVPVAAAVGALAASLASGTAKAKGIAWMAVGGPAVAVLVSLLLYVAAAGVHSLFPELPYGSAAKPPDGLSFAGLLVALQLACITLLRTFAWTAAPMASANLGSIVPLQRCFTGSAVQNCLEAWRKRLDSPGEDTVNGPAAIRLRDLLRESLYRDMIGLIPVYSGVLLLGLWFGRAFLLPAQWQSWWWLPVAVTAALDYVEDTIHLTYCRLHQKAQAPPTVLAAFSGSVSTLKGLLFAVMALFTLATVAVGTWKATEISFFPPGQLPSSAWPVADLRAKVALVLTGFGALTVAGTAVGALFRKKARTA